jgi:hypothetical protein
VCGEHRDQSLKEPADLTGDLAAPQESDPSDGSGPLQRRAEQADRVGASEQTKEKILREPCRGGKRVIEQRYSVSLPEDLKYRRRSGMRAHDPARQVRIGSKHQRQAQRPSAETEGADPPARAITFPTTERVCRTV